MKFLLAKTSWFENGMDAVFKPTSLK